MVFIVRRAWFANGVTAHTDGEPIILGYYICECSILIKMVGLFAWGQFISKSSVRVSLWNRGGVAAAPSTSALHRQLGVICRLLRADYGFDCTRPRTGHRRSRLQQGALDI